MVPDFVFSFLSALHFALCTDASRFHFAHVYLRFTVYWFLLLGNSAFGMDWMGSLEWISLCIVHYMLARAATAGSFYSIASQTSLPLKVTGTTNKYIAITCDASHVEHPITNSLSAVPSRNAILIDLCASEKTNGNRSCRSASLSRRIFLGRPIDIRHFQYGVTMRDSETCRTMSCRPARRANVHAVDNARRTGNAFPCRARRSGRVVLRREIVALFADHRHIQSRTAGACLVWKEATVCRRM